MTTPDTAPSEQPETEIQTAPASATPQESAPDIDSLTEDEKIAVLLGEPLPAMEKAAPEQPQDQGPPPVEETPAKPKGWRVRLDRVPENARQETADALALMTDGKAANLEDALHQLRGTSVEPTPNPEPPASEAPQEQPQIIQELNARITELRAERKAAASEFDDDKAEALSIEIDQINRHLAREEAKAELFAEQQQQKAREFEAEYDKAIDELEEKFPEVLEENSRFTELLEEKLAAARFRNDPGLADPRFILTKAREAAALLTPPASPAPSVRKAPAPPAATRPTGATVAPAHNHSPRPTEDQIRAAIDNASVDELLEAALS